nr:glycosyltransferase [uncultured Bacteroides sp.]
MANNSNSLVSIVIITYNSSEYVLETLESAKQQTYQNIELIVSDDCSTDNTVAICREWLEQNKSRFVRTELIVAEHNTGIPANCNKGYKKAQGEFIKCIAGDDILLPNCVEDLVNAIGDDYIITGICKSFYLNKKKEKVLGRDYPTEDKYSFFNNNPHIQHKKLLTQSFNFSPGVLLRKEIFDKVGWYDEQYRYIEDLPFWLKCSSSDIKIALLQKAVVLYRTNHNSMNQRKTEIYNTAFYSCLYKFRRNYIYPQIPWYNIAFWETELLEHTCYFILVHLCKNKRNKFTSVIFRCFYYLFLLPYPHRIKKYWNKIYKLQKEN